MTYLNVNGKDYKGQLAFRFRDLAEKKYTTKQQGNEVDGFTFIHSQLLDKDAGALSAFWDCALAHHKERPTVEEIEEALYEKAGDQQNYDALIKEAYKMIDESGFFKERVKKFWNQYEMMGDFIKDEDEKKAYEKQMEEMKKNHKELTGKKK